MNSVWVIHIVRTFKFQISQNIWPPLLLHALLQMSDVIKTMDKHFWSEPRLSLSLSLSLSFSLSLSLSQNMFVSIYIWRYEFHTVSEITKKFV